MHLFTREKEFKWLFKGLLEHQTKNCLVWGLREVSEDERIHGHTKLRRPRAVVEPSRLPKDCDQGLQLISAEYPSRCVHLFLGKVIKYFINGKTSFRVTRWPSAIYSR